MVTCWNQHIFYNFNFCHCLKIGNEFPVTCWCSRDVIINNIVALKGLNHALCMLA